MPKRKEHIIWANEHGASNISVTFTRAGLEVSGYYDHFVGLEGMKVPWEEIDAIRQAMGRKIIKAERPGLRE